MSGVVAEFAGETPDREARSNRRDAPMPSTQDRLPPASEQALGALLIQDGLLSAAQLLAVQQYGREHNLDLRQAILKLKLLPEDRLGAIVAEQVPLGRPSATRSPL